MTKGWDGDARTGRVESTKEVLKKEENCSVPAQPIRHVVLLGQGWLGLAEDTGGHLCLGVCFVFLIPGMAGGYCRGSHSEEEGGISHIA